MLNLKFRRRISLLFILIFCANAIIRNQSDFDFEYSVRGIFYLTILFLLYGVIKSIYFRGLYINKPLVYFFEDTEINIRKAYDSNKAYFLDFMKYSMLCKSMNIFGFWSLLIKLTLFHILKIIPKSEKIYRYSIKFRKSDIIGNPEKEELFLRLQKILSIR